MGKLNSQSALTNTRRRKAMVGRRAGTSNTRMPPACSGFTLIELMLSLGIITMLVAGSVPVYNSFAIRNDLDITGQQIASTLRRAQLYSRGMEGDSAWSVSMQSTSAILFKGTVFASRDQSYDESIVIPATITVSGLGEVQFAKFTAAPNTTGTITLTSSANDARSITVNAKGRVDY